MRRKLIIGCLGFFIMVMSMVCLLPSSTLWADGYLLRQQTLAGAQESNSDATPTPEPTTLPDNSKLNIDNKHIYKDMDKTYDAGYLPKVDQGKVQLVLPLLMEGKAAKDQIRVALDLGDPASSPFVFGNYDQTVKLKDNSLANSSKTVVSYLIDATLPLVDTRVNGRYPVVVKVQWQSEQGNNLSADFTLYVTITDGIDPNVTPPPEPTPPPTPEREEPVIPVPRIMLTSTLLEPTSVEAGKAFAATITLQNTSPSQTIRNIKITVKSDNKDIMISTDSNSFYLESIATKGETSLVIHGSVAAKAVAEVKSIQLAIEYEGYKAAAYSSNETILVPVTQPLRLEYDKPTVPKEVNTGETFSIPLNVMNLGLSTIHNVKVTLEGAGFIPDGTVFLGNVESGASKQGDMYVFVSKKTLTDVTSEDGEEYGFTQGKITFTYEDELGQTYDQVVEFNCNINPMVIEAPTDTPEDEKPASQSQWWVSVIVGGVIILGIGGFLTYRKISKKRQAQSLEDDFHEDT